ncbi:MAG: transporter substrate-binding domain-containing protein, partial [Cyanobacteria bacterium J06639_1]
MAWGAIAGCSGGSTSQSSSSAQAPADTPVETLTMVTSPDYPPYELLWSEYKLDGDREDIIGFDIDIAQYIADELGYELEVVGKTFDEIIPVLEA